MNDRARSSRAPPLRLAAHSSSCRLRPRIKKALKIGATALLHLTYLASFGWLARHPRESGDGGQSAWPRVPTRLLLPQASAMWPMLESLQNCNQRTASSSDDSMDSLRAFARSMASLSRESSRQNSLPSLRM